MSHNSIKLDESSFSKSTSAASSKQTTKHTPLQSDATTPKSTDIPSSTHHPTASSTTHHSIVNSPPSPAPKLAPTDSSSRTSSSVNHTPSASKKLPESSSSTSVTSVFVSAPGTTVFVTSQATVSSDSSSQAGARPTGNFNNDLVGNNSFWSKKGAQAGVFTAVGCIALGIVIFLLVRRRRRLAAERRRKFSQAIYVNGMTQRRSFYDNASDEIAWPSFAALPRSPPSPPRRRPVPEYIGEHFYHDDPQMDTSGLSISIPAKAATMLSPRLSRPSPASSTTNPFSDPHVPSIASDVPLLHRTLRTDSTGHANDDASIYSHSPSSAPSTPSFYPASLAPIDEHERLSLDHSSIKPVIHMPLVREAYTK